MKVRQFEFTHYYPETCTIMIEVFIDYNTNDGSYTFVRNNYLLGVQLIVRINNDGSKNVKTRKFEPLQQGDFQ